ncbi:hypothetical protein E2C01_049088 [Portunus trituberculatus]|uniref:Uncharacterized protein n=1 Tax=Portunus trituberculatus TaxID=210409 RepID=A0A5B7GCW7_PORTR|nr:hypothetical protein [Portunus trituberculatus]
MNRFLSKMVKSHGTIRKRKERNSIFTNNLEKELAREKLTTDSIVEKVTYRCNSSLGEPGHDKKQR